MTDQQGTEEQVDVVAGPTEWIPVTFDRCSHVEGPFYHRTKLAAALAGRGELGHVYVVEPTGPFEDDPNVTNKRFPGNVTRSYRTRQALQIVGEVQTWEGHAPEVLNAMLDNIARLREQGLDIIED